MDLKPSEGGRASHHGIEPLAMGDGPLWMPCFCGSLAHLIHRRSRLARRSNFYLTALIGLCQIVPARSSTRRPRSVDREIDRRSKKKIDRLLNASSILSRVVCVPPAHVLWPACCAPKGWPRDSIQRKPSLRRSRSHAIGHPGWHLMASCPARQGSIRQSDGRVGIVADHGCRIIVMGARADYLKTSQTITRRYC